MSKNNERIHAVELRQKGHSLSYISQKIAVSRGTLSHWLRDIPFSPNEITLERMQKARAKSAVSRHNLRSQKIAKIRLSLDKEIGLVTDRDLQMIGIGMLAKTGRVTGRQNISGGSLERIELTTSDAKLAKLCVLWLTKGLHVNLEHIYCRLAIGHNSASNQMINFWHQATTIPKGHIKVKTLVAKRASSQLLSSAPFGSVKIYLKGKGRTDLGVLLHRKIIASIDRVLNIV
jgi:transcriptional regulator with XRE-family HTH domain